MRGQEEFYVFDRNLLGWLPRKRHVLIRWFLVGDFWVEQLLTVPGPRRVVVGIVFPVGPEDFPEIKVTRRWVQMMLFHEVDQVRGH